MKCLVIACFFIIIARGQGDNDVSALQSYSRALKTWPWEKKNSIDSKHLLMVPNKTEKVIQEGTELKIQCTSEFPVKFSFLNSMFWSCETKNETSSKNGKYTFLIRQARSRDTGWYACAPTSTEIPNDWKLLNSTNGDIRWIYIFVNSSKPFVDWLPALPKTIIVTGTHAVVPCRTTSPELDVKLLVNYQKVEKNETISFDPKIGYTIKRPAFEQFESLFTCQFAGVEDNYILRYSTVDDDGRKPKIIMTTSKESCLDHGENLEIQCDGGSAVRFAFPLVEGTTSAYDISSGPNDTRIFRRFNVTELDSGWYGCAQKNIDTTIPYFSIDYTRNEISWIYVCVKYPYHSKHYERSVYSYVGKNFAITPNRNAISNLTGGSCLVHTHVGNGTELFQFPGYGNFYQGNDQPDFTNVSKLISENVSYTVSSPDDMDPYRLFLFEIPKSILRVGENLHGRCEKASYNADAFCLLKLTLPKTVTSNRVTYTFTRRYDPLSDFNVYYKIMNFTIKNFTKNDDGVYSCECEIGQRMSVQVQVLNPESPTYMRAGSKAEHKFENREGMTIRWVIDYSNYPGADAKWLNPQSQSINASGRFEVVFQKDLTILSISNTTYDDSGTYSVEIRNRTNQQLIISMKVVLKVIGTDSLLPIAIPLVLCILIVSAVVLWLCIMRFRRKKAEQKWKDVTLARFNEEPVYFLDPTSANDDQTVMLKYDEKWEFPRKLLKLGKELGKGAFGVVRIAQAKSICPGEAVTTVAVKMVRSTYSLNYMTALSRELKILVYLGKHINIVNLFGACTKKISYGELLVIVEFCRFGNMRDHLLHRRDDFINQLESTAEDIVESTHSLNRNDSKGPSEAPDDLSVVDKDSVEPKLPSAYQVDHKNLPLESMTTQDLICWVWQVSRGMAYLGSKKVVHGDLAARNILLADNNVVKICDFGLAAMLFKDDDKTKQEECLLPVKWMAVESIKDGTFSIKSDVWSFGIVLWEFFSLGETPYPGISTSVVYQKLVDGYRMEQPNYAPKKIYNVMKKCWKAEPSERPSFADITRTINGLMAENVDRYYLDMDGLYAEVNEVSSQSNVVSFSGIMERVQRASINLQINRSSSAQAPTEIRF